MISRTLIYDLEFIRCEMELKLAEALIKNRFIDYSDAKNKIQLMTNSIDSIYKLFENLEEFNNKKIELELINKKLMAEILHLSN